MIPDVVPTYSPPAGRCAAQQNRWTTTRTYPINKTTPAGPLRRPLTDLVCEEQTNLPTHPTEPMDPRDAHCLPLNIPT